MLPPVVYQVVYQIRHPLICARYWGCYA